VGRVKASGKRSAGLARTVDAVRWVPEHEKR